MMCGEQLGVPRESVAPIWNEALSHTDTENLTLTFPGFLFTPELNPSFSRTTEANGIVEEISEYLMKAGTGDEGPIEPAHSSHGSYQFEYIAGITRMFAHD